MKKWSDLSNGERIGRLFFIFLVLAVLFWIPITRAAILWVLPLGSGIDDLLFFVFLLAAIVFGTFKLFSKGG